MKKNLNLNFNLIADHKNIINNIIKNKNYNSVNIKNIQEKISQIKKTKIENKILQKRKVYFEEQTFILEPKEKEIYQLYLEYVKENRILDFDDLLIETYLILTKNQNIVQQYQNQFTHIFIDEFQDTNLIQYQIFYLLTGKSRIFAVGDERQRIYKFQGASDRQIELLKKRF